MKLSPSIPPVSFRRSALLIATTLIASLTSPGPVAAVSVTDMSPTRGVRVVVEYVGGFVPPAYSLRRLPSVLAVDDKLYLPAAVAAVYPGPAVDPVEVRKVKASTLRSRAVAIYNAAVTPKGGWGLPMVADAPSLQVTVTVDGRTRKVLVDAYGMNTVARGVTRTQSTARVRLAKAVDALSALPGVSGMYSPALLEAWVYTDPGLPVPMESENTPLLTWPEGVSSETGCHVLTAAQMPVGAVQDSLFTVPVGSQTGTMQVVFRPVLPTEHACARF